MTQLTEYTLTALMSLTANTDKITETCSKEQILFLLLNSVHLLHQVRVMYTNKYYSCEHKFIHRNCNLKL